MLPAVGSEFLFILYGLGIWEPSFPLWFYVDRYAFSEARQDASYHNKEKYVKSALLFVSFSSTVFELNSYCQSKHSTTVSDYPDPN